MTQDHIAQVMDEMSYGFYIIGSKVSESELNGMMADWVMQVSFEPRLVAVAFENDARTLLNIRNNKVFTINALSQDAMALAAKFAQPYYGAKIKGRTRTAAEEIHHKLEGIAYSKTSSGCPILAAAMAWLDCEAEQFVPAGDHTVVIARVVDGRLLREAQPITSSYTGWNYSG
jgi:flavin reductase (DIM6/NTAB) family NADH-FMN oxidoreductase RutF